GILQDAPWFDHIVPCQDKSLQGLRHLRAALQPLKPDAGLLLTNTTHSFLSFKFAGVPNIYGYRRNLRKYFLTDGPEPQREGGKYKPLPMQEYYLELCRYLGLVLPLQPRGKLHLSDVNNERGLARLRNWGVRDEDMVIGLNPGASFGSSKCWPAEYFARLAEMLQESLHCRILLLVGPGEEGIAQKIVDASCASIINTGTERVDLADLKPLIKRCDLLVTNDTGPRHYAAAFDVPHIVLMGPTNAQYTNANLEKTRVLQRDLPCVPCHKKICPLGHHACMREITPEVVMVEVHAMLQATSQSILSMS
ncbi:MAG: glycosyltransferase family 9 protein, partial [Gammaproteobacteria bacterium]|nr:glycosyltransferase family 9 protein [Gammaproteobacteria bacterium]